MAYKTALLIVAGAALFLAAGAPQASVGKGKSDPKKPSDKKTQTSQKEPPSAQPSPPSTIGALPSAQREPPPVDPAEAILTALRESKTASQEEFKATNDYIAHLAETVNYLQLVIGGLAGVSLVLLGLTVWTILVARRNHTASVETLRELNGFHSNVKSIGQKQADIGASVTSIASNVSSMRGQFEESAGAIRAVAKGQAELRSLVLSDAGGSGKGTAIEPAAPVPTYNPPVPNVRRQAPVVQADPMAELLDTYNVAAGVNRPGNFESKYPGELLGIMNADELARSSTAQPDFAMSTSGDFWLFQRGSLYYVVPRVGRQFLPDRKRIWEHVFVCPETMDDVGRTIRLIRPARFESRAGRWSVLERGKIETN